MSGLKIFCSNKLEILAEQLAEQVKAPRSSYLAPEIVVVQSKGMQRWISLALAEHNGICANIEYPFPNTFLEQIAQLVLGELAAASPFDPDILMFKIMKQLTDCIELPGFERLKDYLSDDPTLLKRLQLSNKLADIYDQYQVFRPDMLFRWEKGREEKHSEHRWQAQLWRQLVRGNQGRHRARLQNDLLQKINTDPDHFTDLPERVFIFGISYLPLFHLKTLVAISQLVDMNFFLLNPCREYWGDIVSEKQMQTIRRKYPHATDSAAALHLEEGNRLLASMGFHGKNFFTLISGFDFEIQEFYQDPPCTNMLTCIQADILNLRQRRPTTRRTKSKDLSLTTPEQVPPFRIEASDTSIQVHSCHSPMREIEVLHDNLVAMFDQDPTLRPKDVVVMTPDIEAYAPYIHTVFEAQTDDRLRIPFGIADQNARKQGRMIDGFFSLLDLKGSRVSAARVMELLEFPGIREKFRLTEADIQTVERWIRDTRIRWGIDNQSRRQLGLPAVSENTWQAGIQRLLLGYAMPGNDQRMFGQILPYDNVEGNEVHSFGKFLEFANRVFGCIKVLSRPQQLQRWQAVLRGLLVDFFLPNEETEREIQRLRQLIDDLADRQAETGFDEKIEIEPIRFYLNQRLEKQSFGTGFMTGGVTFCAMLPMRSIPFKVICLIGMNSDMFPRDFQPLTFDLIAMQPRPGDRSRRNDDKYLFLESLISARNTLYISYVGQGIQDNSHMPPSVLVSELLDTIEQGFDLPNRKILEHVVTCHRLQAFSPQYFRKDAKLFSYSAENCAAAAFLYKREEAAPLITGTMPLTPADEEELRNLDIETLCRFFSQPTRFLLQQRLGIYLEQPAALTAESENFELNFLDQYRVGQNLVSTRLKGMDLNDFRPVQKAMGVLPHANVGELTYSKMSVDVEKFVSKIEPFIDRKISETSEVNMEIAGFQLKGRLPEIHKRGLIHFRYAKQRAGDLLRSWIYHLIFCEVARPEWTQNSILIFRDRAWQFNPTANSREILKQLLSMFRLGLEQPIHFFPIAALEYFQQRQKKGSSQAAALARARAKWMVSDFGRGESEDPYYDICFKGTDPLDESFEDFAETVFEPLLANCTQLVV